MNKIEIKAQLEILEWVVDNNNYAEWDDDIHCEIPMSKMRDKKKELQKRLEQLEEEK
jgi:hypothetical protein